MKANLRDPQNTNRSPALSKGKQKYAKPILTIFGDVKDITKKQEGFQDHNQGNNNMGNPFS